MPKSPVVSGFLLYRSLFSQRTRRRPALARKVEIEQILGTTLAWARGDDIKASKVSYVLNNVSITNETDWLMMAKFQAEWSKKMYDIFVPLIREMA